MRKPKRRRDYRDNWVIAIFIIAVTSIVLSSSLMTQKTTQVVCPEVVCRDTNCNCYCMNNTVPKYQFTNFSYINITQYFNISHDLYYNGSFRVVRVDTKWQSKEKEMGL